jgi:hypothetical protein
VQEVFERLVFEAEIEKLDACDRLFLVVKEFAGTDFGPDKVSNIQMDTSSRSASSSSTSRRTGRRATTSPRARSSA